MSKNSKNAALAKVPPKEYRIYGIFDFNNQSLVHVGLDLDQVVLEFDLEGYDEENYDVISFDVVLA